MCRYAPLVCTLIVCHSASIVWGEVPLSEVLTGYRRSLAVLQNCVIDLTHIESVSHADTGTKHNRTSSICTRLPDRASCEYMRWVDVADPIAPADEELQISTRSVLLHNRLIEMDVLPADAAKAVHIWKSAREDQLASWQGAILCGYFPGDIDRIDRVLEKARCKVRELREHVVGLECVVVDAESEHAQYSVWFAPERDWCIVKMVRTQQGESLLRRQAQEVQAAPSDRTASSKAKARWSIFTQTLDNVAVEQIDGSWIPVEGTCSEELTHSEGPPTKSFTTVKRTRVNLHPSVNDELFALNIPDGTRVRFVGEHNAIPHEWRDGMIIPREHKEATERLKALAADARFVIPVPTTSQWDLARGPALFVSILGALAGLHWLSIRARALRARHQSRRPGSANHPFS